MNTTYKVLQAVVVTSASLAILFACTKSPLQNVNDAPDMSDTTYIERNQLPKIPKDQQFNVGPIQNMLTAEIAIVNKQPNIALQEYQKLSQQTNDIQIIKRGLQIALYANDYQAAFDATMRWAELEPNNQQVKDLAAALVIEDPTLAFNLLNDALKENPNDIQLVYSRGLIASKLGKLTIAEHDFNTVLKVNPKDIKALSALGYILTVQPNRLTDAANIITRAMTLEPHNPRVLDNMGWLRYQQHQYADAEKYLREAYVHEPDTLIAGHLLAVLIARGNQIEAKKVWKSATEKNPNDPNLEIFKSYFVAQ